MEHLVCTDCYHTPDPKSNVKYGDGCLLYRNNDEWRDRCPGHYEYDSAYGDREPRVLPPRHVPSDIAVPVSIETAKIHGRLMVDAKDVELLLHKVSKQQAIDLIQRIIGGASE